MRASRLLVLAGFWFCPLSGYAQLPCRVDPGTAPIEDCARTLNAPPAHVPLRTSTGGNITWFHAVAKRVEPVYPEAAVKARISGSVIVAVIVNEEGLVYEARVLHGNQLLNQAALDAVLQWQFFRVRVKGEPMPFLATVTLEFNLRK